jgi:hypothetical protein
MHVVALPRPGSAWRQSSAASEPVNCERTELPQIAVKCSDSEMARSLILQQEDPSRIGPALGNTGLREFCRTARRECDRVTRHGNALPRGLLPQLRADAGQWYVVAQLPMQLLSRRSSLLAQSLRMPAVHRETKVAAVPAAEP